jgi:hypothetical protein
MPAGALLDIQTSYAVTINGQLEAGLYQIFAGNGTVSFGVGSIKEVCPQWWGAKGDGVNDDTTAINLALQSCVIEDVNSILETNKVVIGSNVTYSYRSISGVAGISTGYIKAQNLRGSVSMGGSGSKNVTLPTSEPDANYYIAISASANETFWITNRTATGFTVNSSNPASNATVHWILVR